MANCAENLPGLSKSDVKVGSRPRKSVGITEDTDTSASHWKFEILNPKFETNPKSKILIFQTRV